MTPRVSVVVPTYKRPALLNRCLVALLAQDFQPDQYEVIVADDAGSEETKHLVQQVVVQAGLWRQQAEPDPLQAGGPEWSWRETGDLDGSAYDAARTAVQEEAPSIPVVRYVAVTGQHGPAAARNAGWRAACGDIVAFTDDDCVPAPGWLRAGVEAFDAAGETHQITGVTGQVIMPLPPEPTDYELNAAGLQRSEFVTANCFYRRDGLLASGGFDERFTAAWREDSDLYFTLLRSNGHLGGQSRFIRAPEAIVFHPVRPAPWGISLRQQRKNAFNALLYKKHPQLYRERIQARPPWRYYAILTSVLALLAGALTGWWLLAWGSGAVWFLLTGQFCLSRLQGTSRTPHHVAEMCLTSVLIPPLAVFWRLVGAVRYRVLFF